MSATDLLEPWVSPDLRAALEARYYARINEQACLENLAADPTFLARLNGHTGLFADHGVVHMRNVATNTRHVLAHVTGLLLPPRDPARLARMQGLGVLLALWHDVGMVDFSEFGRRMHPEFGAQALFDPANDALLERHWRENSGNLAWQLQAMAEQGLFKVEPQVVLRELLALAVGHSKSQVPVEVLNDPARLRARLLTVVLAELGAQYRADWFASWTELPRNAHAARFYGDPAAQAFAWLTDPHPALCALVEDATDTVRALRVADALRQRGTVLATSGQYEIYADHQSGNAVFALRYGDDHLFLLEVPGPIAAGEANIAASELDAGCDLRLTFHRGFFEREGATAAAVQHAALVAHDIARDVIESMVRPAAAPGWPGQKRAEEMRVLLEETSDNPRFARDVQAALLVQAPWLAERVLVEPSLQAVSAGERERYLAARPVMWSETFRREFLARIQRAGHLTERIDLTRAFARARLATLEAGETLVDAGAPSSFVYVPLDPGLKVVRQGGYDPFSVQPWMPLGVTGVVRGAPRNATLVAESRVRLVMIPKAEYLAHWHATYDPERFRAVLAEMIHPGPAKAVRLSQLDRVLLLENVSFFRGLSHEVLMGVAAAAGEVEVTAGEPIVVQGDLGQDLYVVIAGHLEVMRDGQLVNHLGAGDVFGELSLLTAGPRLATVTAREDARLLVLRHEVFQSLLENSSTLARAVITGLAGLIRNNTEGMRDEG